MPLCALFFAALLVSFTGRAQAPDTATLKRGYSLFRPVPEALLRDFTPDRPGISQSAHTLDAGHF
ncbi:MAG: hypothetical protein H7330_12700 [Hymenobacteraceae bacterium]|nr:hypothetical protein [Hymenobacteraceae bacterium]